MVFGCSDDRWSRCDRQRIQVQRQDLAGISVTMTDQRAELSGTIMTDKGEAAPEYFILLYPADERYWSPHRLFSNGTRAKEDGTYVVRGLRAGTYRLATILDAEFGAWFDSGYLRRIDPSSTTVTFTGDERKTLNLRVADDR